MFGVVVQAAGMATVVDDDEDLFVVGEFFKQIGIGLCADMLHGGAFELIKKCGRIWRQFAYVFKAAIKAVLCLNGGLGGGTHYHRAAVVLRQLFYRLHNRQQQGQRQHLRLIENNYAT